MIATLLVLALAPLHAFTAPRAARAATQLFAAPPIDGLADRLLAAKVASGKTFDDIAAELGFTNTYTTQLLLGQAQLKPDTRPKLEKAVPKIKKEDLDAMMVAPFRSWDDEILKGPTFNPPTRP